MALVGEVLGPPHTHTLSFPLFTVMKPAELATIIGTATLTGLIALTTMVVAKKLYSSWTAGGRAQVLHDLLLAVRDRNLFLVDRVLPMVEPRLRELHDLDLSAERITKVLFTCDHPLTFQTLQCSPYAAKNRE